MKTTMSKMKNILNRINDRLNVTEGKKNSDFEDTVKEIAQNETQQEKMD